ncbi:MAG: DNA translocase FtsK [Sphaerochaetaceae bacterium]|nr:DNA translocase FtsK [Sphaerochaetaceae bacterium]MDD4006494.1 DNA translocase FtsK [Sphaerochaetaceae bacterium]MDD4395968.1 DNA translocase FtsK [Sphaerochaetaceae bacterium]
MSRKFNARIIILAILLLSSFFSLLVFALPFFTESHTLGSGFLAQSGAFLLANFGFFAPSDPLYSFSLLPLVAFLLLESLWVARSSENWLKCILSIPVFVTLRALFMLSMNMALPSYLEPLKVFHSKWLCALLLLGEVSVFALVTSLMSRSRRKSKPAEKTAKAEVKKAKPEEEAIAQSEPGKHNVFATSVPEFKMFKNQPKPQPQPAAEEAMKSSVNIGIYDVVRKEASIAQEQKLKKSSNSWNSFQPGNLTKKVAEDEKALKAMMEMEKKTREEKEEKRREEEAARAIAEARAAADAEEDARIKAEAEAKAKVIQESEEAPAPEIVVPEETPVPKPEVKVVQEHIIAPAPALKEDDSQNGWNKEEEGDYDLVSGVGGLGHADPSCSNQYLLNRQDLMYKFPPRDLLKVYPKDDTGEHDEATIRRGNTIVDTLSQFKVDCHLVGITRGPTVTLYELALAPGVKVSAVTGLTDNIAMDLAVQQVRLLTPIPGKQAIGVEVPNFKRETIGFSEIIDSLDTKKMKIPVVLGEKITGESVAMDLASAPHVLIAGATGSGKSVCVNSMICSILYTKTPKQVRMIMVDPKIVELKIYNGIPHLLTPVITDPKKAIKAMQFCLEEMERRYHVIGSVNVRNIAAYNEKIEAEHLAREKMPYIVVIMDEFADLMAVAGKELEMLLHRLSAMARAVGIHLVFATQRPSADVVTGLIKNNLPTKIAFSVTNQINSKIILDCSGAEKLLGKGDMLYATSSIRDPERIQGAFLSDPEVESIADFVKTQGKPDYLDEALFEEDDKDAESEEADEESPYSGDDAIFDKALKIVCERQSASASYLQRRLCIGYNKAARLVERMEELGYVGPARGSKPRELLKMPE